MPASLPSGAIFVLQLLPEKGTRWQHHVGAKCQVIGSCLVEPGAKRAVLYRFEGNDMV